MCRAGFGAGTKSGCARGWGEGAFTLRGLMAGLGERGLGVDYCTMWAFALAEGLGFKKTALASEQDRPDVARKRARWKARQGSIDPKRLVLIDETRARTNMAPLRGWAAPGRRLIGRARCGQASISHTRSLSACFSISSISAILSSVIVISIWFKAS